MSRLRRLAMILTGWSVLIPATLLLHLLARLRLPMAVFRPMFRLWCRLWVFALGVRLHLRQHHQAPLPRRFILIANHPSAFEDIGIPALFDVDSLAKEEVRDWFLVGRISAAAGTLYVRRESRSSRRQASARLHERLLQGRNVAVYPEGGVKGMRVHPFRFGVFDLSLQTGTPILPVFIRYTPEQQFHWHKESLPRKIWQIMQGPVAEADFHLYDAIEPSHYPSVEAYCDAVYRRYLGWQAVHLEQK